MVKRAPTPAEEVALFVPQIEDAAVGSFSRSRPLRNEAVDVPTSCTTSPSPAAAPTNAEHGDDDAGAGAAAAMKRARCLVASQGRCAAAYAELAPYVGATTCRTRAELVDAAVELLLRLLEGNEAAAVAGDGKSELLFSPVHYGRELLAWLPGLLPVPLTKSSISSSSSSKRCDIFSISLSRQQYLRLNSTELVQRARVFVALSASNAAPSALLGVALVELLHSVCRTVGNGGSNFRRCLSVWRALRHVMELLFFGNGGKGSSPSRTTAASAASSRAAAAALLQHVDLLMVCLELRDRPLESAARTYSREYARFDVAMTLPEVPTAEPDCAAEAAEEEMWKQRVVASCTASASVSAAGPQRVNDVLDLLVRLLPALQNSPSFASFFRCTKNEIVVDDVNRTHLILLEHLAARVVVEAVDDDKESEGTAADAVASQHVFETLLCRVWWTFLTEFVVAPVNDVFGQRRGAVNVGGTTTPRDDE